MTFYALMERLKLYGPELSMHNTEAELLSVEVGAPAGDPEADVLYVVDADNEAVPALLGKRGNFLLCGGRASSDSANLLMLSECRQPDQVFRMLQPLFMEEQRLASYAMRLLAVLSAGGSLQRIVEEAMRILNNAIFVFDAGFKIVAAAQETSSLDPHSQQLIEQRYLAPDDMKAINHDNIHERVLKSPEPILIHNPYYQGKRIVSRINLGSKNVGHLGMTDAMRPFVDSDIRAVAILRDVIAQRLQQDEFNRNSRGFHYEYLITDLLDGKVAPGKQLEDRLACADLHFEALLYVTVAELARSTSVVNPTFIRDQLETMLPGSRTILYKDQIVVMTTRREAAPIDREELERLRDYCVKAGLYCGMSNSFTGVAELPSFYRQALRALELGAGTENEGKPSLYVYRDYAVEHLAEQFRRKELPEIYCHPAVRALLRYDEKTGSSLTATLHEYLLCERNVSLAAQRMYLHRNTLMHRLKRMAEIAPMDLDDPNERQYLLTSLLVLQNRQVGKCP